jgi:methylamine dehydrogenase accessory protein MauD
MIALLVASQLVLWIAVLVLGVLCVALARQVGVLHERIAPAGALMLAQKDLAVGKAAPQLSLTDLTDEPVEIGRPSPGRSQLIFFLAPDCPICKSLLGVLKSSAAAERGWLDVVLASDGPEADHLALVAAYGLERFPYVVSEALGRAYGVAKLPHAVLIAETGLIAAMGLVNSREHLESLFEAKERGVASLQDFLSRRTTSTAA